MDIKSLERIKEILKSFITNHCILSEENLKILVELIDEFEKLPNQNKESIRMGLSNTDCRNIIMLSDYLANSSINNKSYIFLKVSLILISIEDFKWDPRENLIRLSIIWFVAEKLKSDPKLLFTNAATISSAKTAEYINDFIIRPKNLKSLNAFGLIVKREGENYGFVPKPPPWERK